MDEVSQEIERIEKRTQRIRKRSIEVGEVEFWKRGAYMLKDLEWLIAELKKARAE